MCDRKQLAELENLVTEWKISSNIFATQCDEYREQIENYKRWFDSIINRILMVDSDVRTHAENDVHTYAILAISGQASEEEKELPF